MSTPSTLVPPTQEQAASAPPPTAAAPPPSASPAPAAGSGSDSHKLRFCTVCASNNNRSMEAHLQLSLADYPVISFGTGSLVRLPGPSITQPNVYSFDSTSYETMLSELAGKDTRLYKNNGVLTMLERNAGIKFGPERWHNWPVGKPRIGDKFAASKGAQGTEGGVVDVVITCEERCWDSVVDNLLDRGGVLNRPVHVINVEIKDNHEEALVGGRAILDLANRLNSAAVEERGKSGDQGWMMGSGQARQDWDAKVPEILGEWQEQWPKTPAQWTLAWF